MNVGSYADSPLAPFLTSSPLVEDHEAGSEHNLLVQCVSSPLCECPDLCLLYYFTAQRTSSVLLRPEAPAHLANLCNFRSILHGFQTWPA